MPSDGPGLRASIASPRRKKCDSYKCWVSGYGTSSNPKTLTSQNHHVHDMCMTCLQPCHDFVSQTLSEHLIIIDIKMVLTDNSLVNNIDNLWY